MGVEATGRRQTKAPLQAFSCHTGSMDIVISYTRVEKVRVLRAALLEAHRHLAATINAGATWSQIEAEEEKAAKISREITAIRAAPAG